MTTRNEIMDSLKSLMEGMATIKTVSRRFQDYTTISQGAEMPFMAITRPRENYPQRAITSLPPKRTFKVDLTIFLATGQSQGHETIPDEEVCDILDELDDTIAPPIGSQVQTLGGLVDHCYIEGEIICVPGDLDGIGMIQIPLEIVLP